MDLRLLNKLKVSDTVSLIIKYNMGDILDYYIVAQTVSHSVICVGTCSGSLDKNIACFNIRISSIVLLIEKGFKFVIQYSNGELCFVTEDDRLKITPLYVEYNDPNAASLLDKYTRLNKALMEDDIRSEKLEMLEDKISKLKYHIKDLQRMDLLGDNNQDLSQIEEELSKSNQEYLDLVKKGVGLEELDVEPFTDITLAAAKRHSIIDFCGTYAITDYEGAYIIQKGDFPILAVQGPLLYTLIRESDGKGFFMFEDQLVFMQGTKDKTVVFVERYMPNNVVDSSIITRGVVKEKYVVSMKGVLNIASLVRSKFPTLKLDMGNSCFLLTNDNGEVIRSKFEVEDAKTVQLNRLMKGKEVKEGVTMAVIDIPNNVHSVLSLFKNDLEIYVKDNKVIFHRDNLYLVFSR